MVLVVMAVVLFLAARNWKTVAPTALEIHKKNGHRDTAVADSPESFEPASAANAAESAKRPR